MDPIVTLSFLHAFAALNGLMVAVILMVTGKAEYRRSRLTLGGFLLIAAILLGLFALLDRGALAYSRTIGVLMEVMSAAMPALFLDYVFTTVGLKARRNWFYLIIPVFGCAAFLIGDVLGALTNFGGAIGLQMVATTVGFLAWKQTTADKRTSGKRLKAMRLLPFLFGLMAVLHAAQVARFLLPGSALLFDLVPLIGTIGLTGFVIATLFGSRILSDMVKTPAESQLDPTIETAIQNKILETGAFLDQGVTLEILSALIPSEPSEFSGYINSAHGKTFREWLKSHRTAYARKLLASPDEARTSVEAIGLMSGFKSRSAFYEAFRATTGQTPHQYRDQALTKSCPETRNRT